MNESKQILNVRLKFSQIGIDILEPQPRKNGSKELMETVSPRLYF